MGKLATANISRKTGERLFRTHCISCEKIRKDLWRLDNKEHHNLKQKNWALKNKEKKILSNKKYNLNNPEKVKQRSFLWKKKNKILVNVYTSMRRNRIKKATPACLNEWDIFYMQELYGIAKLRNLEVDHIIPLTHKLVCGLHVPANLQLLTKHDNCVKSNDFKTTGFDTQLMPKE